MSTLSNKTALVTGASRGIGRAIAERLAKDGAKVIVNFHGSQEAAHETVAAIASVGGTAKAVQADVTDAADRARLVEETVAAFGSLDILVNNAGIAALGPIGEVTEADWDRLYASNAKAPFFLTQAAAPHMGEGGRIIFVSSSTASFPMKDTSLYASSKTPVRVLAEVLAKELGPKGITANTVIPGPTAPGMFANAPEHLRDMAADTSPYGRIGHPDDIAGVVAFLASDDARWVSGQQILTNGAATI